MINLNGESLTDRFNNPSVTGNVGIRTFFLNNGTPVDPYDVSSCVIFNKLANSHPSSILDSNTSLLKTDGTIEPLMAFGISGTPETATGPHDGLEGRVTSLVPAWTDPTLYQKGTNASGIYKLGTGEYVAALDGTVDLSGHYLEDIKNGCSATEVTYIDVWTVKMTEDSEYQIFINEFKLGNQNYISTPTPLIFKPSNKLRTKHVALGSTVDMVVTTDVVVQNRDLSEEVKNILQNTGINTVTVTIEKMNPAGTRVAPIETVQNNVAPTQVTSDNTIIYRFNTSNLTLDGSESGSYAMTVKYNFYGQTIISDRMYFVVR